jgi:hypothetical protein
MIYFLYEFIGIIYCGRTQIFLIKLSEIFLFNKIFQYYPGIHINNKFYL